jgi:TonB family protein
VLKSDPRLAGRATLKFTVEANGQVTGVSLKGSGLQGTEAERQVARAVQGMRFPKPKGGGLVVVSYPFVFRATGAGAPRVDASAPRRPAAQAPVPPAKTVARAARPAAGLAKPAARASKPTPGPARPAARTSKPAARASKAAPRPEDSSCQVAPLAPAPWPILLLLVWFWRTRASQRDDQL